MRHHNAPRIFVILARPLSAKAARDSISATIRVIAAKIP
jgi:hypothetical protein